MENNSSNQPLISISNIKFESYYYENYDNKLEIFNYNDVEHLFNNENQKTNEFSLNLSKYEHNWKFMYYDWLPKLSKEYYIKNCDKVYPHNIYYFVKGLDYEYGIIENKNYKIALSYYFKSAELNCHVALFKLFFIYANNEYAHLFLNNKNIVNIDLTFENESCNSSFNKNSVNKNVINSDNKTSEEQLVKESIDNTNIINLNKKSLTDIDFAMLCLIKSVSYLDVLMELNKIEPLKVLMSILQKTDINLLKCKNLLFNKAEKYYSILSLDSLEIKYLYSFLNINFSKNINNFYDSFSKFESIAKVDHHNEACFKLACIYYFPPQKELIKKNVPDSILLFKYLKDNCYWKSYFSFYKLCEDINIINSEIFNSCNFINTSKNNSKYINYFNIKDKNLFNLILIKQLKQFCHQIYTSNICSDKLNFFNNSYEILDSSYLLFLNGSVMSLIICFEIITQIILKNKYKINNNNTYNEYKLKFYLNSIFEFVNINCYENDKESDLINCKYNQWLKLYIDYDIYVLFSMIKSYFYYKGLLVDKDIYKAIYIIENTFKDKKSIKNYRKVYYYLGKYYELIGNRYISNMYYKKTFKVYVLSCEFPYHYYIIGKLFYKGIEGYLAQDIEYAKYFFYLGANYKNNSYFINIFYSIKCQELYSYLFNDSVFNYKHKTSINLELSFDKTRQFFIEKYINEEDICIVCTTNYKQVIFKTCGHKHICLLCFNKLNVGENTINMSGVLCPVCKTVSKDIINDLSF